jgi:choline dehydrogenase-like flavoprotein
MDFDYDVIIIGSGVGGALCAWKLSRESKSSRILLLEAGENLLDKKTRAEFVTNYELATIRNVPSPYARLESNTFAPSSDGTGDPIAMNRYYVETGPDLFKSGYQRMVGGSTWAWRGNTPRFVPNDFKLKSTYQVGDDWPLDYDALEPYYSEAEKELGVAGNHDEWNGLLGGKRSKPFPMPAIVASYGDTLMRQAIGDLTIDGTKVEVVATPQARNSERYHGRSACQGNSTCIPICPSGAKYDAGVHIKKALDSPHKNVELRTGSVVTRLKADPSGEVHTVFFRDWTTADRSERGVTGKIVVLAANAVETPKLWLLSALKNKSDQVGRNLMDHLAEEVTGLFPEPLFPFRGPQSTISVERFRDGDFRKVCGAFRMTIGNDGWGRTEPPAKTLDDKMWDAKNGRVINFGKELQQEIADRVTRMARIGYSTEQLPSRDNRVTLSDEKDGFDVIRPKVAFKVDDYSKRALAYGHSVARRIWEHLERTVGATEVEPKQPTFKYNGAGHLMGTMRMGTDAGNSVVDSHGRSHEHPTLFLVGSSVFVTGSTANPTLTLAALTLRTADAIAKELA